MKEAVTSQLILGELSTLLNTTAELRPNIYSSISNKLFASLYTYCSLNMPKLHCGQ